jgi:hypothetical protein
MPKIDSAYQKADPDIWSILILQRDVVKEKMAVIVRVKTHDPTVACAFIVSFRIM